MTARNGASESDILNRVTVRLMAESELGRFHYHLQEDHYLESSRLAGQSLRYVAEVDGRWVGLLSFSAPALHLKARERWIGWRPRQRARRLPFVVNNSRFLVLLERQRYPNLASRVLGLVLRRLSGDWQEQWGHPVLVVESFVDESRYRGTCYWACGFEAVGPNGRFWSGQPRLLSGTWPALTALLARTVSERPPSVAPGQITRGAGPL